MCDLQNILICKKKFWNKVFLPPRNSCFVHIVCLCHNFTFQHCKQFVSHTVQIHLIFHCVLHIRQNFYFTTWHRKKDKRYIFITSKLAEQVVHRMLEEQQKGSASGSQLRLSTGTREPSDAWYREEGMWPLSSIQPLLKILVSNAVTFMS